MKKLKTTLSLALSLCILASMAIAAGITASANHSRPDIANVVNSDLTNQVKTNRLRLYMPEEWRNKLNDSYDGYDLASCTAGIYWWKGSYSCKDYCAAYDNVWPGYVINKTEPADSNIFVADVPKDVTTIIFNNTVDGGEDKTSPNYVKGIQTENVNTEGYDPGKDPYGFYPNGIDSFDGMIYVCNPKAIEVNPFSGKETYKGCWFYYYGDGKYGIYKTLREAEAAGAVYQNGKFPPYGLQVTNRASVTVGETTTVTPSDSTAVAFGYDESIISVTQDKTTGVATITGLRTGKTNLAFRIVKNGEYETVDCEVIVTAPVTTISVKADKTSIYIGTTTKVTATVVNAYGMTSFRSTNPNIATVDSDGNVTGIAKGSTQIIATNNGASSAVTITVQEISTVPGDSFNTTIDDLIKEGNSLSSDSSPNAYAWLVKVKNINEMYPNSSVYSRLQDEINTAQHFSDISISNCKNKILGYLSVLKSELKNDSTEPIEQPSKPDISAWTVDGLEDAEYTGKVIKPEFDVVSDDGEYADFTVKYKNNKNAGTATVTITGTGDYTGTIVKTFKITKADQPMTAKAVTKAVKSSVLKKSKVAVKGAITVKKAQGALTYKKLSGSKHSTISKSGVITVKKGKYKKNTVLTANVKVTAKGGTNYKSGSKTVKVKIKVK